MEEQLRVESTEKLTVLKKQLARNEKQMCIRDSIYNDPLGYADLILNGDLEKYLKNVAGSHGLED